MREILLAALARTTRAQLIAFPEQPIDLVTAAMFQAGLDRLHAGEPLAYVTGLREFWSLPLVVAPAVLVPRPETELLVELALARLAEDPAARGGSGHGFGCHRAGAGEGKTGVVDRCHRHFRRCTADCADQSRPAQVWAMSSCARAAGAMHWAPSPTTPSSATRPMSHRATRPSGAAPRTESQHWWPTDEGYADLLAIAAGARSRLKAGGLLLLEHGARPA